jgi:hypothetical protein
MSDTTAASRNVLARLMRGACPATEYLGLRRTVRDPGLLNRVELYVLMFFSLTTALVRLSAGVGAFDRPASASCRC